MTVKGQKNGSVAISQPEFTGVGQRLKFLRVSIFSMTRDQFADLIKIPIGTVKHYENGTRKPSAELLTALAECCLTHSYFDWLFHGAVSRSVQIDPVSGTHNLSLINRIASAINPLASGPAVLPAELAAEIRAAIPRSGEQR